MSEAPHEAPGLPEVRDEAPPTPLWVPVLGLGLLVVIALMLVLQSATAGEQTGKQQADGASSAEAAAKAAADSLAADGPI